MLVVDGSDTMFWFLFEKTAERVEVGIRQYVRNCEYRALKKGTEIVFLEKHQQMLIHLCSYFFIKLCGVVDSCFVRRRVAP